MVHAFLPTHELTGLAVKINGDFDTDPSRTRVILDERTADGIENVAMLMVDLIGEGLAGDTSFPASYAVASLVPFQDPRMVGLQRRSFKTELLKAIQRAAEGRFEDLRYRPGWLNPGDFETLAAGAGLRVVPRELDGVQGLSALLRFMGAREATLSDLTPGLGNSTPSILGCAEVVAQITKLHATKQIGAREIDSGWRLWPVDGEPVTFDEARGAARPLDRGFTDMVSERIGGGSALPRLITSLSDPNVASKLVPDRESPEVRRSKDVTYGPRHPVSPPDEQPRRLSLTKWRSAEQQVLSLLELQGWDVKDVSRQYVGYDIEGVTPKGEEVFVEVKSIEHRGQSFTLTSNEEATARQKGTAYRLAIVRQAGADLEVAFIPDPANRLELTRQCRQWVWECSSYEYDPERFLLE